MNEKQSTPLSIRGTNHYSTVTSSHWSENGKSERNCVHKKGKK